MERENQTSPSKTELGRTYGAAARAPAPRRDLVAEFGERAAAEGTVAWMKARPVASAAIGLGLGVLIGLALGRSIR